ncbi:MAG: hypothetical protein V7607_4123 [Solirubrobacteraceae bacterium]
MKNQAGSRAALFAAVAALAVGIVSPGVASAAVALTITGDDGNPISLGGAVNIRNMNPQLGISSAPTDRLTLSVAGPTGAKVAWDIGCTAGYNASGKFVDYVGNGVYTVTVRTFASGDLSCATPSATQSLPFTITASTALGQPQTAVLTRKAGSTIPNTINLPIDLNPGALSTEAFVERNVTANPDGSLPGAPEQLFPDPTTKTIAVRLDKGPGVYVVAAHAKSYTGALNPQTFGPWAAPVAIHAFAPFDTQKFTWTDTRGPSYRFSATIRATGASGTVTVGIRRGTKGKFRSYGKVKIRKHRVSKRIRLPRTGKYQMRLGYKGNATVAGGSEVRSFRITRRISFARAALVG